VVCLDTMGQDREFTTEEKKAALRVVRDYKDLWEKEEQANLLKDRDNKLK